MTDTIMLIILVPLAPIIVFLWFYGAYSHNKNAEKVVQNFEDLWQEAVENPEISKDQIDEKYPQLSRDDREKALYNAFKTHLNNAEFSKAESILDYHDIDPHNLLSVVKALRKMDTDDGYNFSPKIFKITLEKDEAAFEKIPCNWQRIHTYLAPLEGEIEQADILDTGNIYITTQRLFFVGKKSSETVWLEEIAYMDREDDTLQLFRSTGPSAIFAFPTRQHAIYAEQLVKPIMAWHESTNE